MFRIPSLLTLLGAMAPVAAMPLSFSHVDANYSQSGYGPEKAIDQLVQSNNGWAVGGSVTTAKRIWFELDLPHGDGRPDLTEFHLSFRGTNVNSTYLIRQFRLFYTTDSVVSGTSSWTPVTPSQAITSNTAGSLAITGNYVALGSGSFQKEEDWTITAQVGATGITGFMLEAYPTPNFVGTNSSGNFILTEFGIELPGVERLIFDEDAPLEHRQVPFSRTGGAGYSGVNLSLVEVTATAGNVDFSLSTQPIQSYNNTPVVRTITLTDDTITNEGFEYLGLEYSATSVNPGTLHPEKYFLYIRDNDYTNYAGYIANQLVFGSDADPEADPNQDGIANFTAYAFGLNADGAGPTGDLSGLPEAIILSGVKPRGAMRFTLPNPLRSDVRLIVSESTGLSGWNEVARRDGFGLGSLWTGSSAPSLQESNTADSRTVTVPGSSPLGSTPTLFFKLELEQTTGGTGGAN